LGAGVPRSRPVGYSSRQASAVRRRVVAAVLVLLSIVLITIYFRESAGGGLHSVQSAGATVLRPFEVAAERVSRPFRDAYGYFSGLFSAKSENKRLRGELDKYRQQATLNLSAASDNAELRGLLHFTRSASFPNGYDFRGASIISRPPPDAEQQVVIDVGRTQGVHENDPVVTGDGLVGTVTKAAHNVSQVTLLTDDTAAVSARDANTGAIGVVKAGSSGLAFDLVTKDQNVREGDTLITSGWKTQGLSSIYPPKIPIGVVTAVGQNEVDLYKHVQLTPFAKFKSVSAVLVLVPKQR
jgi:rod shape-determining protein MreC